MEGICESVALLTFHDISKVKSGELAFITGLSSFSASASSMPATRSVMSLSFTYLLGLCMVLHDLA